MAKTKIRWAVAQARAEELRNLLGDTCWELHVAGSVRRKEMLVGDLELVGIPHVKGDLFGQPMQSLVDLRLEALVRSQIIQPLTKDGPRYKQFLLQELQVDLFLANPDNVGLILALRTGPADFSRRLVRPHGLGGLLGDGLSIDAGHVWRGRTFNEEGRLVTDGELVPVIDEQAFFALTTCGWIQPEERK